jgi:acetyl-CoA C-acetyltransferase
MSADTRRRLAPGLEDLTPTVVAARRTPIGTAGRSLAGCTPEGLAAVVLRAVHDDLGPHLPPVDDVVLGSSRGPAGALGRVAALQAGLGVGVPGVTVDRQCASGLDAIVLACALVRAGHAALVLAGGTESASQAPAGRARFAPVDVGDPDMGVAAETVAAEAGITRERQDAYAARSHARALAARAAGRFASEVVPIGSVVDDDRPRPLTQQRLGRLPAAFVAGGTVTAGNSCGISDGAAAVAVVPEWLRAERGWPGLRVTAVGTAGVDPARCGLGLVPAARQALGRAGIGVDDLGTVEIVEAFAGQVLAGLDALGIDEDRVCTDGGALALGHPWGASGAVSVVRLFSRLVRDGRVDPTRRYALAAVAAGGGQGVAMVVEPVAASRP